MIGALVFSFHFADEDTERGRNMPELTVSNRDIC
jgi:hypothetical protein